jgi:hypothetical protein
MTEQPPYSLLVRGIDADVLPVAEQFGMGVLPWLLAHRSRSRLGDFMDNREYPRSVVPDALCCWVFHLPPTLDYARAAVGIASSRDGTFRTGWPESLSD